MATRKPNPSRRLNSSLDAYNALHDALDLVKAVQAAGLRGVIPADQQLGAKVAEANAALNAAIEIYPPISAAEAHPAERHNHTAAMRCGPSCPVNGGK